MVHHLSVCCIKTVSVPCCLYHVCILTRLLWCELISVKSLYEALPLVLAGQSQTLRGTDELLSDLIRAWLHPVSEVNFLNKWFIFSMAITVCDSDLEGAKLLKQIEQKFIQFTVTGKSNVLRTAKTQKSNTEMTCVCSVFYIKVIRWMKQ